MPPTKVTPSLLQSFCKDILKLELVMVPKGALLIVNGLISWFGLVGMIFFIPIFAVIYRLVKEWVEKYEQAASVVAVGGIIDEENE